MAAGSSRFTEMRWNSARWLVEKLMRGGTTYIGGSGLLRGRGVLDSDSRAAARRVRVGLAECPRGRRQGHGPTCQWHAAKVAIAEACSAVAVGRAELRALARSWAGSTGAELGGEGKVAEQARRRGNGLEE